MCMSAVSEPALWILYARPTYLSSSERDVRGVVTATKPVRDAGACTTAFRALGRIDYFTPVREYNIRRGAQLHENRTCVSHLE